MKIVKKIVSHFILRGKQNKRFLLVNLLILFILFQGYSYQKSIIIGGEKGWNDLSKMEGVTTGVGRFGLESIELSTKMPQVTGETDLLLTFDEKDNFDFVGNYNVISNNLTYTKDSIKGKGAGLSRGVTNGITLKGNKYSLLGRQGLMGSFTIEFWLSPSIAENGEKILSWRSSINTKPYPDYQMIVASINNNRLEWRFNNVFPLYQDTDILLSGFSTIIPGEWSRHTLTYNDETGCLEYLVDGRTEAIKYITTTNHEDGTVCMPFVGEGAKLEICPNYTGKIDNFRIQRTSYEENSEDIYNTGNEPFRMNGGRFETNPILISNAATLNEVNAIMNIPEQTDIRLFVRSGENYCNWTENYPEWKEVLSGEEISGVTGLYFQVAAELLPDGSGSKTPSVTQLELKYTETPSPLPPFTVTAIPGDSCVTLTWSYSVDDNAGGYYVYYGNRPGEYMGRAAVEGMSPVKVGNTTSLKLTGLENGKIYYFAISSYSRIDNKINGTLSKEVYARPSARLSKY